MKVNVELSRTLFKHTITLKVCLFVPDIDTVTYCEAIPELDSYVNQEAFIRDFVCHLTDRMSKEIPTLAEFIERSAGITLNQQEMKMKNALMNSVYGMWPIRPIDHPCETKMVMIHENGCGMLIHPTFMEVKPLSAGEEMEMSMSFHVVDGHLCTNDMKYCSDAIRDILRTWGSTSKPEFTILDPEKAVNEKKAGVIFNPPATIVYWADGTKTVVKCMKDQEYDPVAGLAMCFMKKALGNGNAHHQILKKWLPKEMLKKKPRTKKPSTKRKVVKRVNQYEDDLK